MAQQYDRPRRSFSEAARREAGAIASRIDETLAGRAVVKGVTIDGPASRDLDDALWLEREAPGGYRLDISIADVEALITPRLTPALDAAAFQRSFTRYLAQGNIPMLPRSLSEERLSLLEGQPRPTITLSIPFDERLRQGEPIIRRTVLTSTRRFNYEEADQEIVHPRSDVAAMLQELFRLAQRLFQLRRKHGALALYDLATGWATTEEGVLFQLPSVERHQTHLIIQECMILANQAMAHFLAERGIPALYRNHIARAIAPQRQALRELLESAVTHPELVSPERVRATVTLALERARYAPTVEGHFGLNLPAYLHATSPLRRYADLVNQRILAAVLDGKPLPYSGRDLKRIAGQINTTEEEIKEAKQAYFRGTYDEQLRDMIAMSAQDEDDSAGSLGDLDAGQFHSVLRMAAESGVLHPAVEEEFLARLDAELPGAHDLFTVLFRFQQSGAAWKRVRQAALEWLQSHPYHAPSLLVMGQQSLGWDEPEWEVIPHEGNFQAQAQISIDGQWYSSSWHTSSRKAQARQEAGAELLARIAGVEIAPAAPVATEGSGEASSVAASTVAGEMEVPGGLAAGTEGEGLPDLKGRPAALLARAGTHAVSVLYELEQQQEIRGVTYSYEQAGPSHAPTFTCICVVTTLDGQMIQEQAQGATKKAAAQAAAFQAVSALLGGPFGTFL